MRKYVLTTIIFISLGAFAVMISGLWLALDKDQRLNNQFLL